MRRAHLLEADLAEADDEAEVLEEERGAVHDAEEEEGEPDVRHLRLSGRAEHAQHLRP